MVSGLDGREVRGESLLGSDSAGNILVLRDVLLSASIPGVAVRWLSWKGFSGSFSMKGSGTIVSDGCAGRLMGRVERRDGGGT